MKDSLFVIKENKELCGSVYRMVLRGSGSVSAAPGQFINIRLDGFYLRRPISVCDIEGDELTIIYKLVGKGTEAMSRLRCGDKLWVLTGLGNGYDLSKAGESPLLIGGGAGIPPLYLLCKELIRQGKKVSVLMGFNKASEIYYEDEFKQLGAEVFVATLDGSCGVKGLVTELIPLLSYSHVYSCGPEPMLKAVYGSINTSGQFSFEERMGCGFGACMGCSCKTLTGYKRICRDGPVLFKEEILWED